MNRTPVHRSPWDPYELAAVLHRTLHLLDRMERASTIDRICAAADLLARDGDLSGWSVFTDTPGGTPRLVLRRLLRRVLVPDGPFEPSLGAVADGGYAPDASRWVVEFYGDDVEHGLVPLLPTLYAGVQAALSFPQATRARQEIWPGGGTSALDAEPHRPGDAE